MLAKDAMGLSVQRRGFSDANLYVAYNTREKVSESKVYISISIVDTAHKAKSLIYNDRSQNDN